MTISNANVFILASAAGILAALCALWHAFYSGYLRRRDDANDKEMILSRLKFHAASGKTRTTRPARLPDADDDVADALAYIKAEGFTAGLLKDLYEGR